jgi:hypothetical protein
MNQLSKVLLVVGLLIFIGNLWFFHQWLEILAFSMFLYGIIRAKEDIILWFHDYKELKFYSILSVLIVLIFGYWFL